ncbi:hypothetical protein Trydic_g22955 [Trypoxylus dichotomus]
MTHTNEEVNLLYEDISLAWEDQKTHFKIPYGDFDAKVGLKSDDLEGETLASSDGWVWLPGYISDPLEQHDMETNMENLNDAIVTTISQSQKSYDKLKDIRRRTVMDYVVNIVAKPKWNCAGMDSGRNGCSNGHCERINGAEEDCQHAGRTTLKE